MAPSWDHKTLVTIAVTREMTQEGLYGARPSLELLGWDGLAPSWDRDTHVTMAVTKDMSLECTAPNCDMGQTGARYKTSMLTEVNAMKLLESHLQLNHGEGQVGNQRRQKPGDRGNSTKP